RNDRHAKNYPLNHPNILPGSKRRIQVTTEHTEYTEMKEIKTGAFSRIFPSVYSVYSVVNNPFSPHSKALKIFVSIRVHSWLKNSSAYPAALNSAFDNIFN